jgi:hypothetical protein
MNSKHLLIHISSSRLNKPPQKSTNISQIILEVVWYWGHPFFMTYNEYQWHTFFEELPLPKPSRCRVAMPNSLWSQTGYSASPLQLSGLTAKATKLINHITPITVKASTTTRGAIAATIAVAGFCGGHLVNCIVAELPELVMDNSKRWDGGIESAFRAGRKAAAEMMQGVPCVLRM